MLFASLPPPATDRIVELLSYFDSCALLGVCKSIRYSSWRDSIVSTLQLVLPRNIEDAKARIEALEPVTRPLYTTFHIAGTDILEAMIHVFPRIRQLKIDAIGRWIQQVVNLEANAWLSLVRTLRCLALSRRGVCDVTPLALLVHLEDLSLSECRNVQVIDSLSALVKLRKLDVSGTGVTTIECAAHMPNLEYLNISYSKVRRFAPLRALKNLHTVISGGFPTDTSELELLGGCLQRLEVYVGELDLIPRNLANSPSLRRLCLSSLPRNLPVLSGVATLQELTLTMMLGGSWGNTAISQLVNLEVLRLYYTMGVGGDIASFGRLQKLREFDLDSGPRSFNPPSFFTFLGQLPALKRFGYSGNDALSGACNYIRCPTLEHLTLRDKSYRASVVLPADFLHRNPNLRTLKISGSIFQLKDGAMGVQDGIPRLEDFDFFAESLQKSYLEQFWSALPTWTSLERLYLTFPEITTLTSLKGMKKLRELRIKSESLVNLDGIEALLTLEVLDLAYSDKLQDITPLRVLTRLRHLVLEDTIDCTPVINGELPCLVVLQHSTFNCLGVSLHHRPTKRCRRV